MTVIRYIHGNILVGHGDIRAAVYRLETVSYPYMTEPDKDALALRLAAFAAGVEADFSVYRVCRAYPAELYVDQAMSMLDERHAPPGAWERYLAGQREYLERKRSFSPEVYVVVSIRADHQSIVRTPSDLVPAVRAALGKATSKVRPVTRHELEALEAAEGAAYRHVAGHLDARRATTDEIQWLLLRPWRRGVAEPRMDPHWKPPAVDVGEDGRYEPRSRDLIRFYNAAAIETARSLEVEHEGTTTHQAVLALGAMPDRAVFPGLPELMFAPLERLDFPVDATAHFRWTSNRDTLSAVRTRVRDAKVAVEDTGVEAVSWEAEEIHGMSYECEASYRDPSQPPSLDGYVSLAVGTDTPEQLHERIQAARHVYGTIKLEHATGIQAWLFEDTWLRPGGARVDDYAAPWTIEAFGALMPIGTHDVGSSAGAYIGDCNGRLVRYDVTEASRVGHSPSVLLIGKLGSGKTITAELLSIQAALRGSLVVDIDPRGDHRLERVPELAGMVHTIELYADEANRGILDPLVVAPEMLREDIAAAYYTELLPQADAAWQTQIRAAVKAVLKTCARPSSMRVVSTLCSSSHPAAREAGEALAVWADSGIGRLAFGDGAHDQLESPKPVTTIKMSGLDLPAAGSSALGYRPRERMAVATMGLVGAYALRLLLHTDVSVHKVVNWGEAWTALGNDDGRRLIDRVNRTGRSTNITLLLDTQLLPDAVDVESLVGTRFVFRQQTETEARRALRMLSMDDDDRRLVDRVMRFPPGRCLMQDVHGRVAEVQIDVVFPGLLDALDTAPRRQEVKQEVAV